MTVFDKIIDSFKENRSLIEQAIKTDAMGFKFDFNKAINILTGYSLRESNESSIEAFIRFSKTPNYIKMVITNGNPYSTIILCAEAIRANVNIYLDVQNQLSNLNFVIVTLFKNNIKNEKQIIYSKLSLRNLTEFSFPMVNNHEVIIIDDKSKYNELNLVKIPCRYVSLLSVDLYYDSDDFESMIDTISYYCEVNFINVLIFKNISNEKMIMQLNKKEAANAVLILTKNEIEYRELQDKYLKKFYINYNPFDVLEIDMSKLKYFN